MMCWVALDRAIDLAAQGILPDRGRGRWCCERDAIRDFVEERCWSPERRSYVRFAGGDELDASVLPGVIFDYGGENRERLAGTVDTIRAGLGAGPFLRRYSGEDGLTGTESAFLACSFRLAEALARTGRTDEAGGLLDRLVDLSNDVGLYAEEIDPGTGEFLGNFPQGLSHLALISAAAAVTEARK